MMIEETNNIMNQMLWGVGIFALGMLVGYMLKVVLVNMSNLNEKGGCAKMET